ncbi:gamma-glutamylcyclotransferase [Rhodovulum sp. DZ06]|uniref:gamma-glutamylcyclotransferase n=1 Tax=Rhodovulum sp. DZ06 TaxID=3425126 RepID=UPI003D327E53
MPIPDAAFRYCPELKGRIQDPATSTFRDMAERYAQFDLYHEQLGSPPDWRLTHPEREATRFETLAGRMDRDLWVFGYGSLIWDPGVFFDELRHAKADGFRRRFCLHLEGGRGSPDRPGLMAALDRAPGHVCDGVVMRIPAALVDEESRLMWMREMIAGSYIPEFLELETPQGPVEALAFLARHDHDRFVDLPDREAAGRIAFAEGHLGTNLEYLSQLVKHLEALGLHDPEMTALLGMCLELREAEEPREGSARDLPGAP